MTAPIQDTPPLEHFDARAPAPVGGVMWTPLSRSFLVLTVIMLAVLGMRFVRGLGAVTNLNDGYPWGIWIAYDVVVGSALAAGGFTVAFVTYILNRGEYHPIVRPAILAALFGYIQAGASVFFDIGRYWEFWHIFWPRYAQVNSILFEVAVCIMTYTLVLFLEFMPVVMERLGWERPHRQLNRVLFFFVALGVVLPTMHQSSLGSLLVVFGPQVHPLYQTNLLPLLFLVSCIGMGLAAVVFEGTVSALALHRPFERKLLGKLMTIGTWLMVVLLAARFIDLAARGVLGLAFEPSVVTAAFWIENLLFATPILLLSRASARRHPQLLFISAGAMAAGGLIYRISAYLIAYETGPGWRYFPSLGEVAVTAGLIAFEVLAITYAIRLLPVLPEPRPGARKYGHTD